MSIQKYVTKIYHYKDGNFVKAKQSKNSDYWRFILFYSILFYFILFLNLINFVKRYLYIADDDCEFWLLMYNTLHCEYFIFSITWIIVVTKNIP